jgi:hypothetical protein
MHFKVEILFLGPASGFSTETGERGLKAWAKQPSKTAQKRGDSVFSKQVCERIHERILINSIADCLPLEEETGAKVQSSNETISRCVNFVVELGQPTFIQRVLPSGKPHKIQVDFPIPVLAWFTKAYGEQGGVRKTIELFTELVLPGNINLEGEEEDGLVLRAHPNYRSEGPWYDYANILYEEEGDDDQQTLSYPCKLACFFKTPEGGNKMALVQEVQFQSGNQENRQSQLFEHWTLESRENKTTERRDAVFVAIPVESLSDRVYAIDPMPVGGFSRAEASDFDILVVKYSRQQWPLSFLKSPAYFEKYQWS